MRSDVCRSDDESARAADPATTAAVAPARTARNAIRARYEYADPGVVSRPLDVEGIERRLTRTPWLWASLSRRYERKQAARSVQPEFVPHDSDQACAIVVGYGPVGQHVHRLLADAGLGVLVASSELAAKGIPFGPAEVA